MEYLFDFNQSAVENVKNNFITIISITTTSLCINRLLKK